ncbi:hypothetical protein Dfri01_67880 [Dyadobacter frigoris]|nr:hypothetical protein Dfri01_67880 [Dyadobacter frigoris]
MVYPGEKPDIKILLKDIPKSDLLSGALRFADYHNKYDRTESTDNFLKRFFEGILSEEYYKLLRNINHYQSYYGTDVHIIYPISSLHFFDFAFQNAVEFVKPQTFDYQKENINILKAYLAFNEMVMLRFRHATIDLDLKIQQNRENIALAGSISDNDLMNYELSDEIYYQFKKAQLLFLFLKENDKTQDLYKKTLNYFQCSNVSELFNLIFSLVSPIISGDRITVNQNNHFVKICNFLDNFVLLHTATEADFVHLRNNPIYKESEGSYRIIYPKFLLEKIYKGWYFLLNQLNSNNQSPHGIRQFRSFYGFEFTENFLVKRLLNDCFDKKAIRLSGQDIRNIRLTNKINAGAEPDYYVRDWDEVYLFEVKETLLTKEAKTSFDFSVIEKELRDKLFYKNDRGKPKAIIQLINIIRNFLIHNIDFDDCQRSSKFRIYPILILSEEVFNAAGLNNLTNKWFCEELTLLLDELNIKKTKIKPLTVITIDTLTHLNPYLSKKVIRLKTLLDSYAENCLGTISSNKKTKFPTTSFSAFAKNYLLEKGLADKISFRDYLYVNELIKSE